MKLDKFKILCDADVKFGSSRYGVESISLSERCVDISQEWIDTYKDNYGALLNKDVKTLKKELKDYIRPRAKKAKFIPSFIWWWIAGQVIKWVVDKVIEYIINNHT
tara:strand:- start:21 stop:338 length:318 start_codon:yes stop_codon:yes gene_type:complete